MSDDNLDQRVAGLESDVQNLSRNMNQLTDAVRQVSQQISNVSSTDWPVLLTLLGLVVTILGGLSYLTISPIKSDIAKQEYRQEKLQDEFRDHEMQGGHKELSIRMQSIEKQVDLIREEQRARSSKVWGK